MTEGAAPPAIVLDGVGKQYWKISERSTLLRWLVPFGRPVRTELWAVRDASLSVARGETVGVLGRNGSGKTTLLRMLAGVTQPSTGSVTVRGRIAPLISVGVGFHQELTGRENVFVNGMLLGLTSDEVEERFDTIVGFAELAEYIDTPVKFYSSGMFMRLGFSVAIHVEPQILLIDEVLAVGDLAFQLKCFERMRELQQRGTTILLVSHNTAAVQHLCQRAVLLHRGRVEFDGDVTTAIQRHHDMMSLALGDDVDEVGGDRAASVEVVDRNVDGDVTAPPRGEIRYRVRLRFKRTIDNPQVLFEVRTEGGVLVYQMRSVTNLEHGPVHAGDTAEVAVRFTPHLGGGTYRLGVCVLSADGRRLYLRDDPGSLLFAPLRLGTAGFADLDATICFNGEPISDWRPLLGGDP